MASERARRARRRRRQRKAALMQRSVVGLLGHDEPTHAYDTKPETIEIPTPYLHMETPVETPSRAQCPQCGSSQKVRKDGTMGKHTYGPEGRSCTGAGQLWSAT